ncbi:hypothetical protein [Sphingomonas sp. LaA6.9]|uniref:hypothetical protein n=1 Tax=Sphingomonas sp. LaA6.9 TaxID=2919914 RepID=UPI001F4FA7FE|nr:hypothetical protein [Sphingomonas sp. LaA6.9]MCJ8158697.1 hypothetical protein [Sphingomonas sp. LaA6.9]
MFQPDSEPSRAAHFYADQALINLNIAREASLGNVRQRHVIAAKRFMALARIALATDRHRGSKNRCAQAISTDDQRAS